LDEASDEERGELHLRVDRVRADALRERNGHIFREACEFSESRAGECWRSGGNIAEEPEHLHLAGFVQIPSQAGLNPCG
jgi:hypothetical protein